MTKRSNLALAAALAAGLAWAPAGATAQTAPGDRTSIGLDDAVAALLDRRARALAGTIARRALRRGRRAFALGPFASAGPAITADGDLDVHAGGGLGLVAYDISIFITPDQIAEMIKARATRLLLERFAGREPPGPADVERLIRDVIEDIKAELLLELSPRRFERPRFKVELEVDRLIDADAWDIRGTAGVGLSRVFVATGLVARIDDGAALVIPIEIGLPMLLSDGLRAPAVEWFARYDIAATGRDTRSDQVVVGARLMLDII